MKKVYVVLLIFMLALSVRIISAWNYSGPLESDELEYSRLATCIVEGEGYVNSGDGAPTSLRPPFYPFFLAIVYKIFGHNVKIAQILQAIISAMTVSILFLTADRIFDRATAIITGIFSSLYLTFVTVSHLLYSETIFHFLLVLVVYMVISIPDTKSKKINFCIIGLLCGIMTLTRSVGFIVPLIAVFYLVAKAFKADKTNVKKAVLNGTLLLLCFIMTIMPWTIRNYMVFKKPVLISTNAGLNLYQGINWPKGRIFDLNSEDNIVVEASAFANEADRNAFYVRRAIEKYRKNILFDVKMLALRFLFFWNVIDWEILGGDKINYHFLFILPFALLGFFRSIREKKNMFFIYALMLYFVSLTLVFPTTARFRMPIDGYIIMLGSFVLTDLLQKGRGRAVFVVLYLVCTYMLYRYSLVTKSALKALFIRLGLWQ